MKILIMGAGLAGLAAGWTLREQSGGALDVEILERGDLLGGKASSVRHRVGGVGGVGGVEYSVDHGLHVFFDYPNFRRLLGDAAPEALARLKPGQRGSQVFVPPDRLEPLRSWGLPSPLHLLGGALLPFRAGAALRSPLDTLAMARFFLAAILLRPEHLSPRERKRLDGMSVADFGEALGASTTLLTSDIFNAGTHATFSFGTIPSALAMLRSFRMTQQNHAAQEVSYLDGPCGDVVVAPLAAAFLGAGGRITPWRPVRSIACREGRVEGVVTEVLDGSRPAATSFEGDHSFYAMPLPDSEGGPREVRTADFYLSTLAPRTLVGVLDEPTRKLPYFARIDELSTQRTLAYQIHYDADVTRGQLADMAVAVAGPFSTILDRLRVWSAPDGPGSVIELVGEDAMARGMSDAEIMAAGDALIGKVFPRALAANVVKRWFHRTAHDEYSAYARGGEGRRPPVASPLPNLFLGGDFTANSFGVVGMESAVVSGIEAANGVLAALGLPVREVLPMSEPGGLVPLLRGLLKALGLFRPLVGYEEHV
jgi:15-cis-phytoene desaturase